MAHTGDTKSILILYFVASVVKNLHSAYCMRVKAVLILLLLGISKISAQVFVSPSKATTGLTLAIEIKNDKDLSFVQSNLWRFYGVQRVRVDGDVDIKRVSAVLELLDDVQDVQLLKFSGELGEDELNKLEWVENVTLYLRNGKEDQILMNDNLGNLNGLTLIFEVVPEDYYFLESLKKIKSLTLIAPFVKKEAIVAVNQVLKLSQLKHFGISLDRIDDLPESIERLNKLESLTIIDNLSWLTEKRLENLPVLRKNIEYTSNGKLKSVSFQYYASETELMPWDIKHIHTVYPNSRFAPLLSQSGDSSSIATFSDFITLRKPSATKFANYQNNGRLIGNLKDGEFEFQGNTEQDAIYYLGNQAAILVPKLSMRSQTDTLYRGYYTLKCKWLNTPAELFVQGPKMYFDSSRKTYAMAPSAVLEIAASAENMMLNLREGYFIKVVFQSKIDSNQRFYAWNSQKLKWMNFYDYDYNFDDTKIVPLDFYSFYNGKKTAKETYGIDKSDPEWRFESEGYFYLLEPGQNKVSLENFNGYWVATPDKPSGKPVYTLKRGKGLIGLKKEFVDKATESGVVKFQIYDKTETLFPELKAFQNYVFEIETNMNPRDFSAAFIRGAVYSDFRVVQLGTSYYLDLRSETGIIRLSIAAPDARLKKGSAKAKAARAEFIRRYQKYLTTRTAKESAFNSYISSKHNQGIAQARANLFKSNTTTKSPQVGEFKIRSMGVFTWAAPVLWLDTFKITARFTDKDGIPLDIKKVWIAQKNPYSILSMENAENYTMTFSPKNLLYIACTDFKDRVYYLSATDFAARSVTNNSFVYVSLIELPTPIKSMKELEKVLGLNK